MKECTVCKKKLEYSKFHKHPRSKDGWHPRCKQCRKETEYKTCPVCNVCKIHPSTKTCRACYRDHVSVPENTSGWKGGRLAENKGYVRIRSKDHPYGGLRGYVFEHRLVMEKHLGRYLKKHEIVHHKNGVRNDNRIENLELCTYSQPPGKRVEDLIDWCKEFLEEYNYVISTPIRTEGK